MSEAHAHAKHHDYHLVNPSPWPIVGSIGAFALAIGVLFYFMSRKAGDPNLWYVVPGTPARDHHHVRLVARRDQRGA